MLCFSKLNDAKNLFKTLCIKRKQKKTTTTTIQNNNNNDSTKIPRKTMNGRIAQIGRFLSTVFRGNNELFSHKHPRLLNGTQVNRKASSRMENAVCCNLT